MKLTKEEFRHHVLRNQKKRRHLTKKESISSGAVPEQKPELSNRIKCFYS